MSGSDAITLKTAEEIELLRRANQIVASVLALLESKVAPGVSTMQLDRWSEECCRDLGAAPAFKGYNGFPGSLCASINEEVVHGIPSRKRVLREGDIISMDFGALCDGFYGDAAITVAVGEVAPQKLELMRVTEESLYKGIEQARVGNRVSDIGRAVQNHAEAAGFSVVRQFVGHGVGRRLHEAPEVPNFVGRNKPSPRLRAGMVLAIEPMINMGVPEVRILDDDWTVVTADRKVSAHFEHTVAVTEKGPDILSGRSGQGAALG